MGFALVILLILLSFYVGYRRKKKLAKYIDELDREQKEQIDNNLNHDPGRKR